MFLILRCVIYLCNIHFLFVCIYIIDCNNCSVFSTVATNDKTSVKCAVQYAKDNLCKKRVLYYTIFGSKAVGDETPSSKTDYVAKAKNSCRVV